VTFGLGKADRVEALKVIWPDGSEQTLQPMAVDQVLVIEQSSKK
jgi:hypothetical protein